MIQMDLSLAIRRLTLSLATVAAFAGWFGQAEAAERVVLGEYFTSLY